MGGFNKNRITVEVLKLTQSLYTTYHIYSTVNYMETKRSGNGFTKAQKEAIDQLEAEREILRHDKNCYPSYGRDF